MGLRQSRSAEERLSGNDDGGARLGTSLLNGPSEVLTRYDRGCVSRTALPATSDLVSPVETGKSPCGMAHVKLAFRISSFLVALAISEVLVV